MAKYTEQQIRQARRKVARAQTWRASNPRAYAAMEAIALGEAIAGHEFGARYLCELTRQRCIVGDEDGRDVRLSNDYAGVFARWLKLEHPEIAHLVRTRPSAFDVVMRTPGDGEPTDGPTNA